jgi:hypothetical protein
MKLSTTRQLLYQLFNTCTILHHLYIGCDNRKQLLPAVVKLTYRAVTMLVMIQYCKKTRLQLNSNLRYHSLNSCNLCPCGLQHYNTTNYRPIPCMPLENILIPCMPLAPHVIDTKKYTYMPLSGTQGMSIKSDGIPGIFSKL